MSENITEPTEPSAEVTTEPAAAAPAAPAPDDATTNPPAEDDAARISRLEAEPRASRQEAGKSRINAKAQAAEDAKKEYAKEIGKILGLVKDDEPADPATLTAELTRSGAEARQAKVELAVFRAAQGTDADPSALLDSRSFLDKVAAIDPSDDAAYLTAITEAVTSNPRLGKSTTAPGMRPNPAQGRSASPPSSIGERIAAAQAAGDMKTAMRLKASQALAPNN